MACTRVADYHPKNAVHYHGAEYHGSIIPEWPITIQKYRALPWWPNTVVNVTNREIVTERSPGIYRVCFGLLFWVGLEGEQD